MPAHRPDEPLVVLEHVSYAYPVDGGRHNVLTDVSLALRAGEIVHLAGRNGTGKTTLLKVIAGILNPTEGSIRRAPGTGEAVYLDQNARAAVAPGLTVREQLTVMLEGGALAQPQLSGRWPAIMAMLQSFAVGLDRKLDTFTAELSGGQRQIVALLCVLVAGADLVLLDEFSASMDPVSADISERIIQRYNADTGLGVIYVSHTERSFLRAGRVITL